MMKSRLGYGVFVFRIVVMLLVDADLCWVSMTIGCDTCFMASGTSFFFIEVSLKCSILLN